jgi:hypothetical protein
MTKSAKHLSIGVEPRFQGEGLNAAQAADGAEADTEFEVPLYI